MDSIRAKAADALRATQRANSGHPPAPETPGVTLRSLSFTLTPDQHRQLDDNYERTRRVLAEAALPE